MGPSPKDTLVPLGELSPWGWISEGGALALSPPLPLRWSSVWVGPVDSGQTLGGRI